MPEPKSIRVMLERARDTKNTVRYESPDEDGPIQTLYIQKSADFDFPASILITVEDYSQ